ncbi:MptD family putative ECF transporter S component [Schaalia sp. 19OD2882]|uniref:MptD family putative ECF transporter S component n=1 Tax=Schaalia sp. 19OD2882 TaxID=2794089 RepID=UPI001C1F1A65|nr:MptD family putative ECF transporter S component [Schaalia sp. 19OD2882]QWW19397.1 MptD family putative ECF transporter S component [Schaalia sp. 19OD2882]
MSTSPTPPATPTPTRPQAERPASALNARALVNVGIFAAIYFVILFLTALIGFISPPLHLAGILVGTLVNATVVILFMARTPHMFAMTLLGTVVGGAMVLLGQFWATVVVAALCGLAADLILRAGRHASRPHVWVAYGVFQFWTIAPLLPVVLGSTAFFERIEKRQGHDYRMLMEQVFTPTNLILFQVVVCLVGIGAAWMAMRVIDRHFARAGLL